MPVIRNDDGSLEVSLSYPRMFGDERTMVSAVGNATAAFDSCEALAQMPHYRHLAGVPAAVFEAYGDSETVMAFALLGWLRGSELSPIDGVAPKEPVTDRYSTPKRQRTFVLNNGKVREAEEVLGSYRATPAGTGKPKPAKSAKVPMERVEEPREDTVWCPPQYVVMKKAMLSKLSPEARAVFRDLPDHRWVGRTVHQVQGVLQERRRGAGLDRELMRLCWVPASKAPADGVPV